jgi:hypothetical protein
MFFSMRKGVSQGASTRYAAQLSLFFALALIIGTLSFVGCETEIETVVKPFVGLDVDLVGTWEMNGPYGGERVTITDTQLTYGFLTSPDDGATFTEDFSGTIRYAKSFGGNASLGTAGVIIIQYTNKQIWYDYSNYPDIVPITNQPSGDFYGIYYSNLTGGNAGATVNLSKTTAQPDNGPTETDDLATAKTKFTEANIPNLMGLGATTPQSKTAL